MEERLANLLVIVLVACAVGYSVAIPSYEELKSMVPGDVYEKLVKIYSNKTLLVVDKLKELDEVFMTLPEATLFKLPTPKAFRNLTESTQRRIRSVYYNKTVGFEEKLKLLEQIINGLSPDELKLIPLQTEVPGLIEFDVPVFMQFNGQFETNLLRTHFTDEEFDVLAKILTKKNVLEVSRARLVGRLLRDVYERNPVNFPIPLGDPDPQNVVPEEIRRLGLHLMFSKSPFDDIDHFSKALNLMKTRGQPSLWASDSTADLTLLAFGRLGDFIRRFQLPVYWNEL